MAWVYILIAGLFEVAWSVCLKLSHGFSSLFYSALTVIGMIASFYFLAHALKHIPLGTAYSVWTGIGTIGAVVAGIVLFGESVSLIRLVCVGLIVIGIAGLKLITP